LKACRYSKNAIKIQKIARNIITTPYLKELILDRLKLFFYNIKKRLVDRRNCWLELIKSK
jgi:hypothetical protein